MILHTKLLSSLEKVFADEEPVGTVRQKGSALRGEIFSFQWAFCPDEGASLDTEIRVESPLSDGIRLYTVGQVPSMLPVYPWSDEYHLRRVPGLYPDPLFPCSGPMRLVGGQWRSLWVEVTVGENQPAGVYPIRLILTEAGRPDISLAEAEFRLEILNARLPEQTLIHTEWFNCDCLAVLHKVPVFSEEHWTIIGNYLENAVRYGINMLLTPVLTPPLDTGVGLERPTVQLVDIVRTADGYRFGFSRLKRYMDLALEKGIRYFEISHLFTQWGAHCAPKVVVCENGEEKRVFGWDTAADSPEYVAFLREFLPALREFLEKEGWLDRCYFHISDEPTLEMEDSYRRARDIVAPLLEGCRRLDALSEYAFYEKGLVPIPIPSNNHIDAFLEHNVPHLWTYYCCCQVDEVSNRMMAMPSARSRILGWQLYKYHIEGFLHWGYNFWFSQYSKHPVDPYHTTDAEDAFPSGDAFLVYPGADGRPVPSIRQLVFLEALQDLRALELLESMTTREEMVSWIDRVCGEPLTFRRYPREADRLLDMREQINAHIRQRLES